MRIRFLVSIASLTWSYGPGDEADFPEPHARALVAGGNAVVVDEAPIEAAALVAPERAMRVTAAKKGRGA